MPAARADKPTPEAMQQLQHKLQAAMQEIAALKKQCQGLEQQQSPDKVCLAEVKPRGRSKEDQLSEDISAMLRTLWVLSVICIAIFDILFK